MRRVLLTFLALLLAAALGGAWYVSSKGFTRQWRRQVAEEFRSRGIEVTLRRLKLDPFRGLVAQDVRVFGTGERQRTLAVIDEMVLEVNYANLVRGKTFLDALELRDANLSLPLDPAKPRGAKIEISKLNARLFLTPQQLFLASFDAEVSGVQISAHGRLVNLDALHEQSSSGAALPKVQIERIVSELDALKLEDGRPQISLTFSGDLSDPDKLTAEATLWAEKVRYHGYRLETLYLSASYRGGLLDLKQGVLSDRTGKLELTGSYDPAARRAQASLHSTLDLAELPRAFFSTPLLDDMVFNHPPTLSLRAHVTLGETLGVELAGHFVVGKFSWRAVAFESGSADFSTDLARWSARDLRLAHASGTIAGDVMQVPGDFRARLQSTMDPKALLPLLSGNPAQVLADFEFPQAPQITLEAHGSAPTLEGLVADGEIKTGPASFRGVPAENAATTLHYENRVLSLAPFRVQRAEGSGTGRLYFDFLRNEVRLERIKASVNPQAVMRWIEPKLLKDLAPYRFPRQPPNVQINGLVHTKGGDTTRLLINVDAPGGMDYTFLKKNLSARRVSGNLLFTSEHLHISELSASLFGGALKGVADISLSRARPGHSARIEVENLDFASVTKLYFNYGESQGRLAGNYEFSGRGDDARTMQGRGELAVTEGNVFAIPFIGPLSGILDGIVPGMGHDVAHKATSDFTIQTGVITTDNLVVQGKGFSMLGHGQLFFLEDKMDFDMRINAQGLPGVLLFPVSKLFEYTADEKLSKPTWRPKIMPKW